MIELLVAMFLRAQLAATGAILIVLMLRLPARRLLGAEVAYGLWILPSIAALASLFPTLPDFLAPVRIDYQGPLRSGLFTDWTGIAGHAGPLALVWIAGVSAVGAAFVFDQMRFLEQERQGRAGPAVAGFWPRMVVPADYAARFSEDERSLIRAHERVHMARKDNYANLFMAACQMASWFNPSVHIAAACARLDQELACDAAVIALLPGGRRRYAETLVKAHTRRCSALACALSASRRHPLEVRLTMLRARRVSVRRDLIGVCFVAGLTLGLGVMLWSYAPI
jgi:beta-lactamase regulating signal transducer with metallopeptidase domain